MMEWWPTWLLVYHNVELTAAVWVRGPCCLVREDGGAGAGAGHDAIGIILRWALLHVVWDMLFHHGTL